jgi:hypothetical protein
MGLAITQNKPISSRIGDVFELVLGIGARVVGLAGLAYFLFAPRIVIGTAGPPCVESSSSPTALLCFMFAPVRPEGAASSQIHTGMWSFLVVSLRSRRCRATQEA